MDPNATLNEARSLATAIQDDANASGDGFAQDARDLAERIEALDEWLSKGGFLPFFWQRPTSIEEHLYEKCRDCHLFVEPNDAYDEHAPEIAPYVHLARDNAADQTLEESHEPFPSGMKANLNTWRVLGPVAMRERFVTPAEWANA